MGGARQIMADTEVGARPSDPGRDLDIEVQLTMPFASSSPRRLTRNRPKIDPLPSEPIRRRSFDYGPLPLDLARDHIGSSRAASGGGD